MYDLEVWQEEFVDYWKNYKPFGIMLWGRQTGKTTTALYQICNYACLNSDSKNFSFFYGSYIPFINDKMYEVFDKCSKSNMISKHNVGYIGLVNGSEIHFLSYLQTKKLIGKKVDLIYIDEFLLMVQEYFNDILSYKLINSNTKLIMSSTPTKNDINLSILRKKILIKDYFILSHD